MSNSKPVCTSKSFKVFNGLEEQRLVVTAQPTIKSARRFGVVETNQKYLKVSKTKNSIKNARMNKNLSYVNKNGSAINKVENKAYIESSFNICWCLNSCGSPNEQDYQVEEKVVEQEGSMETLFTPLEISRKSSVQSHKVTRFMLPLNGKSTHEAQDHEKKAVKNSEVKVKVENCCEGPKLALTEEIDSKSCGPAVTKF